MIYVVRTTSGKEYTTEASEPDEALTAGTWKFAIFKELPTGHMIRIKASAIESVEHLSEEAAGKIRSDRLWGTGQRAEHR